MIQIDEHDAPVGHCLDDVAKAEAELRHLRPVAMLFQSGYLTVKDYDSVTESFTLGVPDEEVRRDLCTLITGVAANDSMRRCQKLRGLEHSGTMSHAESGKPFRQLIS